MTWQPVEIRPNEQQAIVSQPKPGFSLDLKIVCFIFRWKGIRGGSTLQNDCLCNRHFLPFVGVYLNAGAACNNAARAPFRGAATSLDS
jgi:hypothetical protein